MLKVCSQQSGLSMKDDDNGTLRPREDEKSLNLPKIGKTSRKGRQRVYGLKSLDSIERNCYPKVMPAENRWEKDSLGIAKLIFSKEWPDPGPEWKLKAQQRTKHWLFIYVGHCVICFTFMTLLNDPLRKFRSGPPWNSSTVTAGTPTVEREETEHGSYHVVPTWQTLWLGMPQQANLRVLRSLRDCKLCRWHKNDMATFPCLE